MARRGGRRLGARYRDNVGFAAHKVSSNVTLPIGGGRIAYVVAPSTARWFRSCCGIKHSILNYLRTANLTVGGNNNDGSCWFSK